MSDEFADMAIQQLHLSYSGPQDRMLLKVSLADETELSAWLTRRIVRVLWGLLQDSELSPMPMHDVMAVTAEELLERFNQEADNLSLIQGINLSGAYQDRKIAEADPPVLVTDCKLVHIDHLESMLEFHSQTGEVYSIALTEELNHAISGMLQLATQEAAWDLGFSTDMIVLADEATQHVLH
ncbi:hypothetical protein LG201_08775 [Methylobacillus gramineus]|uniref:hypothetical protein n=1 Tax=Methylobacillus gramineus TaxID=755169 RepID=UPI001D0003CE|nr:hypothetical protein [Methylobacillus gramineus]MCB5185296.1 hypothetical protein [Methylobacillus gramineus]